MIYPFSLKSTGIVVGLALIIVHAIALLAPKATTDLLRSFPRSRMAGGILLALSAIWAYWLMSTMDLGEFSPLRKAILIAIPIGAILSWMFVDEFLAVRSLGILALLAADPLLEAAFLRDETSRLFLVCLAYAWVFAALFLVGMPYILRDLIAWLLARPIRLRAAKLAGLAYGAIILSCAILLWK